MERMLKRVGLSRRTADSNSKSNEANGGGGAASATPNGSDSKSRRRRRSKSRRRLGDITVGDASHGREVVTTKSRSVFNIDWTEYVKECKPSCRPRAITRRLCRGRRSEDNELYRSNSFKFERFVRGRDDGGQSVATLEKQISLCDEYSLPVDHVNKKRPGSASAVTNIEWDTPSPTVDKKVELVEAYCDPRDSTTAINEPSAPPAEEVLTLKEYRSPRRNYIHPYPPDDESDVPNSEEDDFCDHCYPGTLHTNHKVLELNSPDSITEAILPLVNLQSPDRPENPVTKRHPSPYYYSDLFRNKNEDSPQKSTPSRYRKSISLETPSSDSISVPKRYSVTEDGIFKAVTVSDAESDSIHMPPNRLTYPTCACTAPEEDVIDSTIIVAADSEEWDEDEMSRQRHLYETAFDCKISRSDDDLDEIDKLTNHPVLVQLNSNKVVQVSRASSMAGCSTNNDPASSNTPKDRRKVSLLRQEKRPKTAIPSHLNNHDNNVTNITQNIDNMHIETSTSGDKVTPSPQLPLRGYTPSPPSTAPLPAKFPGKDLVMNSIRSAPNLPSHPTSHPRLKDLRLPVKSLRARETPTSSDGSIMEFKGRPRDLSERPRSMESGPILEIKSRPRKDTTREGLILEIKGRPLSEAPKDSNIIEFKGRPSRPRHKYSSTESMATSSSGGSMESIRSSTSEGNRSTSSSESRHSTSLSSHSSDSGSTGYHHLPQMSAFLINHASNKLHILSPISDKSSQEPVSETSDNNRNNNSQKCSPEETVGTPTTTQPIENTSFKIKRRLPQNKNLLNLAFQQSSSSGEAEIQGSDSGISIQSREGIKSRNGFGFLLPPDNMVLAIGGNESQSQDLSDLPFDMPKLRRRRINQAEDVACCTSGSATSVDLRDLPFDMPKLRRRLRGASPQAITDSGMSLASSSQSVRDADRQIGVFRPKLTLNLGEEGTQRQRPGLGLSLTGLGLNLSIHTQRGGGADLVDVALPLERQGWYHGAITRVEAECVLRMLTEGSFLVRNSESTKQDYSLSLKSARGFMHMRIQRTGEEGQFILGQFSKPFDSIPEMIHHFTLNRLPIRGAEHMCLLQPVIAQLL